MNKIDINLTNEFKYVSNLSSNTDNTAFTFNLKTHNMEDNCYDTSLYLRKDDRNICLLEKTDLGFVYWEDNQTIILSKYEDNKTKYFKLVLGEGAPKTFFTIDKNVVGIKKLDETRFVIMAKDTTWENKEKDFAVYIEQIPFWSNGGTYNVYERNHLYIYDMKDNSLELITKEENFKTTSFDVDKESMTIIFSGNVFTHKEKLQEYIYEYDINTKETTVLLEDKWGLRPLFAPLLRYTKNNILFMATDMEKLGLNENEKMYFMDRKTKEIKQIINEELNYFNTTGTDARLGYNTELTVDYDEESFTFITSDEYQTKLRKYVDGEVKVLLHIDGSIEGFAYIGDELYTLAFINDKLAEIYKGTNLEQVSFFNDEIFKDKYVAKCNEIDFESNGDKIKGFVLLPENYDPNKKYKAILDVHGGPKTIYSNIYYHEMQVWVSLGYIVMFTNPHGSSAVNDEFSDIRGKYGQTDYEDLMKFVDIVCENYSIDEDYIALTGGSYGGFMTNWMVTHTNRFRVAATQRCISNWISMYGVSDIGYFFADDQNKTKLYDENFFEVLWDHSPLKYVKNCKTPLLIIHSDADYRCPIDQGYQMLTALLDQGVEAKMVLYKGENHELSRSGKPKGRISRLENITNWIVEHC